MEHDIYICTVTKQAFSGLDAASRPKTPGRLQTHLLLSVYFFDSTLDLEDRVAALLEDYDSLRAGMKPADDPTADALIYHSSPAEDEDHYEFEWDAIDSADLRSLLGREKSAEVEIEVAWTIDGIVERVAWPAIVENANLRTTDGPPDPTEDESDTFVADRAVCYDRAQTLDTAEKAQALLNLGISGFKTASIVRGCIRLVLTNDDVVHVPLTSGEPPAL